ncbi:MAG TPA: ComEA family DNA-binding protein [bacterium]|nr:ComEA family DNA-binding protein [bacterium]
MRWTRPEQLLVLLTATAVITGAAALVTARRPTPSIRVFESPPFTELIVQVDGAVARPGLYRLVPGARAADAIVAAGGVTPAADLGLLNQARLLRDGERLTIPRRAAPQPAQPAVDLNAADTSALEQVPGIGPVLARRIVAHRDRHGPFYRLEDLLAVEGIGPRLLARLREHVVIR